MRDRTERIPEGFVADPFDYPFKFLPTKLSANLQYVPQNLRYDRELLEFQARRNALVQTRSREVDLKHRRTRSAMGGQLGCRLP